MDPGVARSPSLRSGSGRASQAPSSWPRRSRAAGIHGGVGQPAASESGAMEAATFGDFPCNKLKNSFSTWPPLERWSTAKFGFEFRPRADVHLKVDPGSILEANFNLELTSTWRFSRDQFWI